MQEYCSGPGGCAHGNIGTTPVSHDNIGTRPVSHGSNVTTPMSHGNNGIMPGAHAQGNIVTRQHRYKAAGTFPDRTLGTGLFGRVGVGNEITQIMPSAKVLVALCRCCLVPKLPCADVALCQSCHCADVALCQSWLCDLLPCDQSHATLRYTIIGMRHRRCAIIAM